MQRMCAYSHVYPALFSSGRCTLIAMSQLREVANLCHYVVVLSQPDVAPQAELCCPALLQ